MKSFKQKSILSSIRPVLVKMERMHPFRMIIYLVISVFCLIYATLSFFFIRHLAVELEGKYLFDLPDSFVISTIFLVATAHFASNIVPAYNREDISGIRRHLSVLMIAGLVFITTQTFAWLEIIKSDVENVSNNIATYLMVFSSIHFVQMAVGVVMALLAFYEYLLVEKDPVKMLIMTTNPHEKAKLQVFQVYWKFLVLSWLVLFLLMLVAL
ncbi:MAG: hypothetical protein U5K79_04015 [Cyclobacteriaceae bacterium]|nr:hypothetical protein [Cyclobacteriaceae bacterium]